MLQAMNTGHEGSISTAARELPARRHRAHGDARAHGRHGPAAPRDPRADRVGDRHHRADHPPQGRCPPRDAHHRGARHGGRRSSPSRTRSPSTTRRASTRTAASSAASSRPVCAPGSPSASPITGSRCRRRSSSPTSAACWARSDESRHPRRRHRRLHRSPDWCSCSSWSRRPRRASRASGARARRRAGLDCSPSVTARTTAVVDTAISQAVAAACSAPTSSSWPASSPTPSQFVVVVGSCGERARADRRHSRSREWNLAALGMCSSRS